MAQSAPRLDFWFEYASTYSYISAMRIEAAAAERGVTLRWRPFLLGPIFGAQGWKTSPFNLYPAKGRYMWRDMARLAERHGLPPIKTEGVFPQNSIMAARIGLICADEDRLAAYTKAVFTAEFAQGHRIDEVETLTAILLALGLHADTIIARATHDDNKQRLRHETDAAIAAGVFGAPSFITADGELFWGDDRLEHAIDWALMAKDNR